FDMKVRFMALLMAMVFLWAFSSISHAGTLTLSQGLRLAVRTSKLLKIARRSEDIAHMDTLVKKSYLLPKVDAGVSQTFLAYQPVALFGDLSAPMSNKTFLAYNVSVEQTLYDFRRNAARYEAGREILETTKLDTERIRNLVEVNFAFLYFNLLESDKMVLVAGEEVDRLESHLKDAKNLYEEGVITKNDLLQAEVRLSDARQRLLAAKNLREINVSDLNNALARPLNAETEIEDIREPVEVAGIGVEKAWKIAEKDRPELRIIDGTLKSLDLQEVSKKAEYYPRIFVKGAYDYEKNDYLLHDDNWSMVVGLSVNLFNGGRTTAEALKIEQQKEKLQEQRNKLVDDIRLEVEKYILESRTARQRLDVTKDAIQQARENLRINRTKYEEGVGTATDVLDAVTLLTVAETNYYRAVYDLSKADAAILFSMGKELSEVYR
ncbi:MAG: TolC family protein, partial [Candidatus Sulfobium sp.]